MLKKTVLMLAVVTAFMSSYVLHRVTAQDAEPLKIGVVDLKRFSEEYTPFKKKVDGLKADVEQTKKELLRLEAEMKDLDRRRELFEDTSARYLEYTASIEKIRIEAAVRLQVTKRHLEDMEKIYLERLYADIRKGIDAYSKNSGYDFVFIQTGKDLIGKNAEELTRMMYMKNPIFSAARHNITDEVIQLMLNTVSAEEVQ